MFSQNPKIDLFSSMSQPSASFSRLLLPRIFPHHLPEAFLNFEKDMLVKLSFCISKCVNDNDDGNKFKHYGLLIVVWDFMSHTRIIGFPLLMYPPNKRIYAVWNLHWCNKSEIIVPWYEEIDTVNVTKQQSLCLIKLFDYITPLLVVRPHWKYFTAKQRAVRMNEFDHITYLCGCL